MSVQIPMLACSSMDMDGSALAFILLLLAAYGLSALLGVANLCLIAFFKLPSRFKAVNFAAWAFYFLPGIILVLGVYGRIPPEIASSEIWMVYIFAMPFVTTGHLIYLLRTRRKFRVGSGRLPVEHGGRPPFEGCRS